MVDNAVVKYKFQQFSISMLVLITLLDQARCSTDVCDTAGIKPEIFSSFQTMLEDELTRMRQIGNSLANPAESCQDILDLKRCHESGQYWLTRPNGLRAHRFHCDMEIRCCGTEGGWARIAHIDMRNVYSNCPGDLNAAVVQGKRLCQRVNENGCTSANFSVHGLEYNHVCGKVIGYQYATTNAFGSGIETAHSARNIDDPYVDGVSITHGHNPRKHIWTFAAAFDEVPSRDDSEWVCPCTANITFLGQIPSFVQNNYFCETGSRTQVDENTYYINDPLWDAKGCGAGSTCCDVLYDEPGHPYFCKQLSQTTSDHIELRVCLDQEQSNEDVLIEQIEIYVK